MPDDEGKPTVDDRPPSSKRRRDDTDPVPLVRLSEPPDVRYWSGVEIARGGMGRVVEATDTLLGRTVALKEALVTDDESLRRFQRETRITARLEHPSIVPVYDAGTTPGGVPYYVMRKVSGRPLERLVTAAESLDDRLAMLPNLVAAAQAVAHAHERGVIHRDLKPANILVGSLGETVVIDWGLAKVIGEPDDEGSAAASRAMPSDSLHTQFGTVFGTPGYMAPEQRESTDVDARSDVYALGATLYHLLTRTAPDDTPPPPIGTVVPGVPRDLATIVDTALARDPAQRYPHAGALAEELSRFLTGRLVASHDYSRRERAARFVRRHKLVLAIAVAAVAAIAVVSWQSIERIVAARDEAVEQARVADEARRDEAERRIDLELSRAKILLETNPTGAVALVRPLAGGPRWKEARAIVAEARAAGVAWRYPASNHTVGVAISPDGTHAATVGSDHVIRIYDLENHTTETLHPKAASAGDLPFAHYAGPDHLALYGTKGLVLVDLARGTDTVVPVVTGLHAASSNDHTLYFADRAGHGWRVGLDGGAPVQLAIDDVLATVAVSPRGDKVLFGGKHGTWLVDGDGDPLRIVDDETFGVSWDEVGARAVANGRHGAHDLHLFGPIHLDDQSGSPGEIGAIVGDELLSTAAALIRGERDVPIGDASSPTTLHVARGGALVVSEESGSLQVRTEVATLRLTASDPTLFHVEAQPVSRYVLALGADGMLAWNLDDVMPRRLILHQSTTIPVGDHLMLVGYLDKPMEWVDALTGHVEAGPQLKAIRLALERDGRVAMIDIERRVWLGHLGSTEVTQLASDATDFAWIDDDHLAVASTHGDIDSIAVATGRRERLLSSTRDVRRLFVREHWLVSWYPDGFWRLDTATGKSATLDLAANEYTMAPGGTLYVNAGSEIKAWNADGTVETFAHLDQTVRRLVAIRAGRVLGAFDDRSTRMFEPGRTTKLDMQIVISAHAWNTDTLAWTAFDTGIVMTDFQDHVTWRLGRGFTPRSLSITNDGSVLISPIRNEIDLWSVDLPPTREDTVRWVDRLTNAHWDPASSALTW